VTKQEIPRCFTAILAPDKGNPYLCYLVYMTDKGQYYDSGELIIEK